METSTDANTLVPGRESRERHEVQFYEDRSFLTDRIARHVEKGLRSAQGILILSEESTAGSLWAELRHRGFDPEGLRGSGQMVYVEAREVLSNIFRSRRLDRERFEADIGALLSRMIAEHGGVHAYGELVNLLLREGEADAALELERLWSQLLAGKPAALLCGYDLSGFADNDALRDVAERHSVVHPAEHLADFEDVSDASRLLGELQHRVRLLESESRARRELEEERNLLLEAERTARGEAELATGHIARLQAVTAALSEAATPFDIAQVIVTEMAEAASADQAVLAVPSEGPRLKLLGQAGLTREVAVDFAEFPLDAPLPLTTAFRSGSAVWLDSPERIAAEFPGIAPGRIEAIACLPLGIGMKRIGAVAFGYVEPRAFTPSDRLLFHDLSRQAALALERSGLLERAEQANRAKDEFLAMLGHELRNPLSPIVTSLQLIRLRGGEEFLGQELEIIDRQVRSLVRLVDDLLDISRITQGRVSIEPESIETAEVVARAVELARPIIDQRLHRLRVSVAPRGLTLRVDEVRIAQALSNLLINAAKYTEAGGHIDVEARLEAGEVAIRVRDDGPGIPPELKPRLFDLFVQGRRTLDRRQGGLGIGLKVARSLVELHGGRISVRSEAGAGAEFTIFLPRHAESISATEPHREPLSVAWRAWRAPVGPGRRVLIVDDNEDGANTLGEALRRMGYLVSTTHDPESGLASARAFPPDIALVDIGLPLMDGYEVARKLRSLDGLENLKLIAITGYGNEANQLRSRVAGFEAHLVKPVDLSKLEETLSAMFPRSLPSRTSPSPRLPKRRLSPRSKAGT